MLEFRHSHLVSSCFLYEKVIQYTFASPAISSSDTFGYLGVTKTNKNIYYIELLHIKERLAEVVGHTMKVQAVLPIVSCPHNLSAIIFVINYALTGHEGQTFTSI